MNAAQKAAYVVDAASAQINNASTLGPQLAYDSSLAAMLAAREASRLAGGIAQSSSDTEEVAQANSVISQVPNVVQRARGVQEAAVDNGATPFKGGGRARLVGTLGGTEDPITPEPEIDDTEPASPII